jgi:hypothetical protein
MSANPQMCLEFLGLVNLNASLVYLIADLQADLKVVATIYVASASTTGNIAETNTSWPRISKLLSLIDKPFAFLMDQTSLVAPRLATIVLEIAPDIDSKLLLSAQSYRKDGILSLVPELSGVRAPELDDKVSSICHPLWC